MTDPFSMPAPKVVTPELETIGNYESTKMRYTQLYLNRCSEVSICAKAAKAQYYRGLNPYVTYLSDFMRRLAKSVNT